MSYAYDDAGRRTNATTKVSGTTTRTVTTAYDARGKAATITTAVVGSPTFTEHRVHGGDSLLHFYSLSDGSTTQNHEIAWDRTLAVPQIAMVRVNGFFRVRMDRANGIMSFKEGFFPKWYKRDAHGSIIGPDANANAAPGPSGYSAFGEPIEVGYVGLGYRSESHTSGHLYLRNREYDTGTGQFTSQDPLDGIDGSPTVANPYHYADNDPLNKVDPLGLRPDDADFMECSPSSPLSGWDIGNPDAGFFERDRARQVSARRSSIKRWATANGISSFLLATLIHHEGGNYLDPWRRGVSQAIDYGKLGGGEAGLGQPSVGIGNIRPSTAMQVLAERYCGEPGWSNLETGSPLIESDDLSISIAAGYLRLLKNDYGITQDKHLFIAYAASDASIRIMKNYNWSLHRLGVVAAAHFYTSGRLSVMVDGYLLGISPSTLDTLLRREEHWESSSRAMRRAGW